MNDLGIYIHIPFCAQKCFYCDFYSRKGSAPQHDEYVKKLCGQLMQLSASCAGRTVDSVYIGGGTPSVVDPAHIGRVLDTVRRYYRVDGSAEITIEANPGTVTPESLGVYTASGVNRISFGVQSFEDATLKRIGRIHTFRDALDSVEAARRAGLRHISCDLMYALPGQGKDELRNAFTALRDRGIDHISLYGLKIEENTPFGRRNDLRLPDDDEQAALYLSAVEEFEENGFEQYEISNFARRGCESRHNLKYWKREEYLGFGPAAHSFFEGVRFSVPRDLDRYLRESDFSLSSAIYTDREKIGAKEAQEEEIMLSLRLAGGIPIERLAGRSRDPAACYGYIERLRKGGLAKEIDGRLALTPAGMLVSNGVISDLLILAEEDRS